MAFSGTPVIKLISTRKVRITGVGLDPAADGVITIPNPAAPLGAVPLPEAFNPLPYGNVDAADAVQVDVQEVTPGTTALFVTVAKNASPFSATITNKAATATGNLEIYLQYH